jgi:hypothetical protein
MMSSPQRRWQLAAGDQSTRDADLVDRAERYGDELDTRDHVTTVAVLVLASAGLIAALAVIAAHTAHTAASPLLSILEDQPACSADPVRFDPAPPAPDPRVQLRDALLVHGHSARVAP